MKSFKNFLIESGDEFLIDGRLPFRFKETGSFRLQTTKLQTFEEFPNEAGKQISMPAVSFSHNNPLLKDLKGITPYIFGNLAFNGHISTSLGNVHKFIKILRGNIFLSDHYEGPLLGLLLLKDFENIFRSNNDIHPQRKNSKAFDIINKHLDGDKDILECQEEPISAGLKEFAKL